MNRPLDYQCYHCREWSPKHAWGPGRTTCPACGKTAPTAAQYKALEAARRLGLAMLEIADDLDRGACRYCRRCRAGTRELLEDHVTVVEAYIDHTPCAERLAALAQARELWGRGALVGYGCLFQNGAAPVFYAGRTVKGRFTDLGMGNAWDEAFANARPVAFHLPREKVVFVEEPPP